MESSCSGNTEQKQSGGASFQSKGIAKVLLKRSPGRPRKRQPEICQELDVAPGAGRNGSDDRAIATGDGPASKSLV